MQPDDDLLRILAEWRAAEDRSEPLDPEEVIREHPEHAEALRTHFEALRLAERALREPGDDERAPPLRALAAERYVGFEPVGQGGMGIVYWAIDTDLNREVAFKVVRPLRGANEDQVPESPAGISPPAKDTPASRAFETLRRRFLREATITGRLEHPGIVPVYELGQTPEGIPYFTMRFVRGRRTLADAIEAADGQKLEARLELLEPFLRVCDTVHYAHSRGIIHRDLKPENVALGEFGEVVVLDWGLARVIGEPDKQRESWYRTLEARQDPQACGTEEGVLGTPGHMAPEAAAGDVDAVDVRSDVYSLGTILFQILTGQVPFKSRSYVTLLRRLTTEEAPRAKSLAPAVPSALDELCRRALARRPDDRPASAKALADAVRQWRSQSAAERQIETWLRDADRILRGIGRFHGEDLLAQLDEVSALLRSVLAARADHPAALALQEQVAALRARGIRDRVRASRVRMLSAAAVVGLALLTVGGWYASSRLGAERDVALRNEERAVQAEAVATEQLWESYLAQATSWRRTFVPGRRTRSLEAVRRAAALRPSDALREEALAALTLTDLRFVRDLPVQDEAFQMTAYDAPRGRYAWADGRGRITVRSVDDDRVLLEILGPGGPVVWTLRFSPNGRYLAATYGPDHHLHVWDAVRGTAVFDTAHPVYRDAADFTADSAALLAADEDGVMRVWDVATGRVARQLDLGIRPYCLRTSPNGRHVAASSLEGGTLRVFDLATGDPLAEREAAGGVRYVAWSPRGELLAYGCGSEVHVWPWQASAGGGPVRALRGHSSAVTYLAFSQAGRLLATGGWDGTIRLWEPRTGRQVVVTRQEQEVVGFGPDDRTLLLSRQVWEVLEPTAFRRLPPLLPDAAVETWRRAALDPRGRFLLDWHPEGPALRDLESGRRLATLPLGPCRFLVGSTGEDLVTAGRDGVLCWPISSSPAGCRIGPPAPLPPLRGERAWYVVQSADGSTLAAWIAASRELVVLRHWQRSAPGTQTHTRLHLPGDAYRACELSVDGLLLATRARHQTALRLLDAYTGEELGQSLHVDGEPGPLFSPTGTWLLDRTRRGFQVWRTNDWTTSLTAERPAFSSGGICFAPRGDLIAAAAGEDCIRLVDPADGRVLATLSTGLAESPCPLAFSPDGCLLTARVGTRGEILVWDLARMHAELSDLGLTWEGPPCMTDLPPHTTQSAPIHVDLGDLVDASQHD